MKTQLLLSCLLLIALSAFSQFNEKSFVNFRESVKDLTYDGLNNLNLNGNLKYYKGFSQTPDPSAILYLDSVTQKLNLTETELELLMQNHFVVTERISDFSFGTAYQNHVFNKDLPVFISTDLILHALHTSYDNILKASETALLMPNISKYITGLCNSLPAVAAQYGDSLPENIADVDLYLTVAKSLIDNTKMQTRYASQENYEQVMSAIEGEKLTAVVLFTRPDRLRTIDFSQFKVRGHYVFTQEDEWMGNTNLEPYFKTMMWLGRIDIPMTPPPTGGMEPPWESEEIVRFNISAFILNEMMQSSAEKSLLQQNNEIITYLVGESDNLTSDEYTEFLQSLGISNPAQLNDSATFAAYYDGLVHNPEFMQQYMGAFYYVNPCGDAPDELPVSFLVSGQRFIIDAFVLANVVFDRIIYNGHKVMRMMPNPLDVLYALGNNNALHFLEDEMTKYPYGTQLALMRYLIDTKEPGFWSENLYSTWLSSIRALNPIPDNDNLPFFMRTGAWNQQKMNTQLAGWTQLRHDNLLYAKPSYTGGAGCSFPFSYVEPYPEFYKTLADYANNAASFFSGKQIMPEYGEPVDQYFRRFAEIMQKLEILATKELNNEAFDDAEQEWLKTMLVKVPYQECGGLPIDGWILDMFWQADKVIENDFINVDIHTQPTDEWGTPVGKVLHTGLGKINLGVCLAKIPGSDITTAYTGAFMSYYEHISDNFLRVTDQEWEQKVFDNKLPSRPKWVYSYLADNTGNAFVVEKSLPTSMLIVENAEEIPGSEELARVFPNPVNDFVIIQLSDMSIDKVNYSLFDISGRKLNSGIVYSNYETVDFTSFPKGVYFIRLNNNRQQQVVKVVKE
ncbi:MAG TPA: hypothetical protein DER09_02435 [Prolixibacteraceae bacterium]|nr:hypothetical protein [Prolixibacteraceae bacterium]